MIERTFIEQGMRQIELEKYIESQVGKAGFTGLEIVKTPLVTRIILSVTRPGLVIGKGGQNIKRLTREIEERFKINNPQIEIKENPTPDLDAMAVVDRMRSLIERGYSWRSVAFRAIRDISKAGAQGVEIVLKGALGGKGQRKRKQRLAEGYMKKTGDQVRLVDYAKATSYPKYGAIGIKVRIVRPGTVFSDKVDVKKAIEEGKAAEEKREEEKAAEKTETPAEPQDEKEEEILKELKEEKMEAEKILETGEKEETPVEEKEEATEKEKKEKIAEKKHAEKAESKKAEEKTPPAGKKEKKTAEKKKSGEKGKKAGEKKKKEKVKA